ADTGGIVGKPLHGEVLAELAVHEFVPFQLLLPMPVRIDLVDEHRAMLPAVSSQITLSVAFEIQAADSTSAGDWSLPDPGVYHVAVPHDVSRKADVDRDQARHPASLGVKYRTRYSRLSVEWLCVLRDRIREDHCNSRSSRNASGRWRLRPMRSHQSPIRPKERARRYCTLVLTSSNDSTFTRNLHAPRIAQQRLRDR